MKQVIKYTGYVLLVIAIGFLIWKFYYILGWILIAAVLSFVGEPLVRFFDSLHFRKIRMPHSLSALFAIMAIVLVLIGLLAVFVPLIINQAETISKINFEVLGQNLRGPIEWLDGKMHDFGIIPEGETMQNHLAGWVSSIVNIRNLGSLAGGLLSMAGNIFIGLFSILFIAFFFLKDENMFEEGLMVVTPENQHNAIRRVITDSKNLLMRYFIGVFLEVIAVMSLITIGLWILGVKNALLIGFFGGVMNIIPYLGPVMGSLIGLSLGLTGTLASGSFNDLLPVIIKLASVFIVVNFIDNNILVPMIYSRSVKSHPLEIFLVIIIGGGLAGLPGMLLAVPAYTLLRVIAKEFFNQFRVIKKITSSMDD